MNKLKPISMLTPLPQFTACLPTRICYHMLAVQLLKFVACNKLLKSFCQTATATAAIERPQLWQQAVKF